MRLVCFVLICFFQIGISAADVDGREDKLRTLSVHLDAVLNQTELALLATSDFLTDRSSVSGAVVEATLLRYANQVDGLRALIVTDAEGYLTFDTYNKIASREKKASKRLYLGDREYFLDANKGRGMRVYHTLIGRTSKTPFLPISRSVYVDEKLKYVAVAIMSPHKLIHPSILNSQYVAVTVYNLDGKFITAFPDGMIVPENFYESLGVDSNENNKKTVAFYENEADSIWVRNEKYGLVIVYSKIEPKG